MLDEKQKAELRVWAKAGKTPQRVAMRCRIVLLAAEGMTDTRIGKREVVRRMLEETPETATQWSTRRMARESGMAPSSVALIWRAHGLKPHLTKGFKLSNDKRFVERLDDIVGLYLNVPEHALVLSCDEKSQIQALDHSQPGLPLRQGRVATQTHD